MEAPVAVEVTMVLRFRDAVDADAFISDVEDEFECDIIEFEQEEVT